MPTSQSSSSGSQSQQNQVAIAIDPQLADRLLAALELIGTNYKYGEGPGDYQGSEGTPDPTRERTARDHDVLRGLLGRTDAPRPLRMERFKFDGGGEKVQKNQASSDNFLLVKDPVPPTAKRAVVESPVQGSDPLQDEVNISNPDQSPVRLVLTNITATKPISRVEIFDDKRRLVAFGPSAGPATLPFGG
jgi:hypothetical protein